jgi:beta-glucosidase
MSVVLCTTSLAWGHAAEIDNVLSASSTAREPSSGEASESVGPVYYESYYASYDEAKLAARANNVQVEEEGAVLLKNDNNALPLDSSVKSVTMLGRASYDTIYRNSSAGVRTGEDLVTLKGAFESAGIAINETVYNAYAQSKTKRVASVNFEEFDIGEESIDFYTDSIVSSFADYNDAAIIVLSRTCGEGIDCSASDVDGINQLSLHQDEKDLLNLANQHFTKIVVLINSGNAMDLGWLDEYNVDACLWIGEPGNYGCEGVANVITGKATPSGKLSDAYATDSLSSAAVQNSGNLKWTNADAMDLGMISRTIIDTSGKYVVQAEGIYVGYKYYETRYEDCVLGQGDAEGDYGIYASQGSNWNYADEMLYPFGYGLSYTTFDQTLDSVVFNQETRTYSVTVTVKNTGATYSGKSVVQLYVQSPYTQYDKDNLVEKSAIQLVGFNKTKSLAPGESQTLAIEVDEYLLASYDANGYESYILDAGDWYFSIGDDSHDALNNVLAAKKAVGLYDQSGNAVAGDAAKTYLFTYDNLDATTYKTTYSGASIENRLEDADINFWIKDAVVYLTRQDWSTFPKTILIAAIQEMTDILKIDNQELQINEAYIKPADSPSIDNVVLGKKNGLTFVDMKSADWDDSALWERFLSQLTIDELISIAKGGGAQSVNLPQPKAADGGDGAGDVQFVAEIVAASTFNPELARARADIIAELDMWSGVSVHWAPGGNLHRTPFSGRNFEYFSEDSIMSYLYEVIMCEAMQAKGLVAAPKHFMGNDQETNRRGIAIFTTEQTWREGALRGFEGAFTKGGALGTMTSYSRFGLTFSAESKAVNNEILHGEWGFKGYTITDFGSGSTADMYTSGTVQSGGSDRSKALGTYIYDNDDGYLLQHLKDNAKYWVYAFVRSNLTNGLSNDIQVVQEGTSSWKTAIIAADIILGVLALASIALYALLVYKKKTEVA